MRTPLVIDIPKHLDLVLPGAGQAAGAYLDRLGKTDCAKMTKAEWQGFLRAVLVGVPDRYGNIRGGTCLTCPVHKLFDLVRDLKNERQPGEDKIPYDEIPY